MFGATILPYLLNEWKGTLVPEDANTSPNERVSLFDAAFPGTLPVGFTTYYL